MAHGGMSKTQQGFFLVPCEAAASCRVRFPTVPIFPLVQFND